MEHIDVGHDFWTGSKWKEPDMRDPLLREYHKALWSKALSNGEILSWLMRIYTKDVVFNER